MGDLARLIADELENVDGAIERQLFGSGDPVEIAAVLVACVEANVGSVRDSLFYRCSVGVVAGMRLKDGREAVIKVHRWNASLDRITAIAGVQNQLARLALPIPRPLAIPVVLGAGVATIEELIVGEVADGHEPRIRRALSGELHRLVLAGGAVDDLRGLGSPLLLRPSDAPLWPEPHDPHLDFEATAEGAEWIDDLARLARSRLEVRSGELVLGHFDWRVGNVGFRSDRLIAVYDLDSLALAPEPVVVGCAAGGFCSDWSKLGGSIPSLEEMARFVSEYEMARGTAFDEEEREILDAANLGQLSYGARCQWSNHLLYPTTDNEPTTSWMAALRERGERGLLQSHFR